MKTDMRRTLARQPFEEKIRKIEQLLQLSARLKAQRGANNATLIARGLRVHKDSTRKIPAAECQLGIKRNLLIISAIQRKSVLQFSYNGKLRTVEPQTYGISTTGREVLRGYERPVTKGAKRSAMAKLFDVEKMSGLRESGLSFRQALPAHNPEDSAMVEVFATLPAPKH